VALKGRVIKNVHYTTRTANLNRAKEFYSGGYTQSLVDPTEYYFSPKSSKDLGDMLFQCIKLTHSCFLADDEINSMFADSNQRYFNVDSKEWNFSDSRKQGPVLNISRETALKEFEKTLGKDKNTYSEFNSSMIFWGDKPNPYWWEKK